MSNYRQEAVKAMYGNPCTWAIPSVLFASNGTICLMMVHQCQCERCGMHLVVEAHMGGLVANMASLLRLRGGESLLGEKGDGLGPLKAPFRCVCGCGRQ